MPGKIDFHRPDNDQATAISANTDGLLTGRGGFGRGGDDNAVDSSPCSQGVHCFGN